MKRNEGRIGWMVDEILPVLATDAVDAVTESSQTLDALGIIAFCIADVCQK